MSDNEIEKLVLDSLSLEDKTSKNMTENKISKLSSKIANEIINKGNLTSLNDLTTIINNILNSHFGKGKKLCKGIVEKFDGKYQCTAPAKHGDYCGWHARGPASKKS